MIPDSQSAIDSRGTTLSNPLENPAWDELIEDFPQTTFFHSSAWLRVLSETYGYRPISLSIGDPDSPEALVALIEVDSWLTGKRGVCLPFTDACPPLYRGDRGLEAATRELLALARARKWKRVEIRAPDGFDQRGPASTKHYTHALDLGPGSESLFHGFSSSNRRALRKAQASGLEAIRANDMESLRSFYGLLCQTRKRHGTPPQPWTFFQSIHRHILSQDRGALFLAYRDRQPVAGALYLRDQGQAIYKFGASDHGFQSSRPNNLVMWSAIQWLEQQDCQRLDFGRTSLENEGLRRFKLSWGTTERILPYYSLDPATDTLLSQPDRSSGWQTRIFRHLPITLSRLAGQLLYKHVG